MRFCYMSQLGALRTQMSLHIMCSLPETSLPSHAHKRRLRLKFQSLASLICCACKVDNDSLLVLLVRAFAIC